MEKWRLPEIRCHWQRCAIPIDQQNHVHLAEPFETGIVLISSVRPLLLKATLLWTPISVRTAYLHAHHIFDLVMMGISI